MNVTYNNLDNSNNILTFTEIPNILKVERLESGTKAQFTFTFTDGSLDSTVTGDSQYYVTFLGETVTNVMNPNNATNKRFFISDTETTALSFALALRNCSRLSAEFNIIHNPTTQGNASSVTLIAKTYGKKWSNTANYLQRNIPNQYLQTSGSDGSSPYSQYLKVLVDVYKGQGVADSNYITTLEKYFYGNECAFDVSPVLATFSEYGMAIPYTLSMVFFDNTVGDWSPLGVVTGKTTIGYHANQSDKYKYMNGVQLLLNKERGGNGDMILYTYSNEIPFSVLCGNDTAAWNTVISVKDSAFNEIYTNTVTMQRPSNNNIVDTSISVPLSAFTNAYYVDIRIGGDTTRFNVIKPLKATEYYQRVFWRNEYGGISFFDFTSTRSESDSVDVETYEKNIFDYYTSDFFERKKIYDNNYKKTVSLTSHLMEMDGKWIFNSLMMSKKVWTEVNCKMYYIIPKAIDVVEDQSYNNIYTAKLQYEYSDI